MVIVLVADEKLPDTRRIKAQPLKQILIVQHIQQ
ncbi:hypothetical protein SAMN04490209_3318 [Pseudomonas rhodesiae]|uniref:Uncharacterized protein n=1 Tax=Pseudomonas rhodesiae TaxID=76760 RepID=A0AAE8HDY1_9PSED|nr:hypothetical protein SAMN04490209_3318 [Pseudomonas rhodesiae]